MRIAEVLAATWVFTVDSPRVRASAGSAVGHQVTMLVTALYEWL
ncbi:hypothetical protein AB5J52_38725 [Streptomyces sp. R39]|uniref:Uncharacterized protein n=1 Tax=Streptomyces sp. R39 TaxID=3238631 RepID=A0AB39R013_9ACTN